MRRTDETEQASEAENNGLECALHEYTHVMISQRNSGTKTTAPSVGIYGPIRSQQAAPVYPITWALVCRDGGPVGHGLPHKSRPALSHIKLTMIAPFYDARLSACACF